MPKKVKARNMRNEGKFSFMWDFFVLVMVLLLGEFFCPVSGPIGFRSMIVLYAIDGCLTLFFLYIMEKYAVTISGLYEKTVINILTNIYTFVIISFINLIFFKSADKFVADGFIAIGKVVALFVTDLILEKVRSNPKLRGKPKLLILGASSKNFNRMKRIKYGVLKNYESWYESIEGMSDEEVQDFVDEQFVKYDAICILDGLPEKEYSIMVKKTMELNIDLFVVPNLIDVGKTHARIVRFDDVLTLYMPKKNLSGIERFLKRAIDIVLSVVGLVIAAIPMVFIALAIKITSPGPIFYCQKRLTKGKKEFGIYKFRTMIPDAEKLSGPKFAEKDDPRITPIGKILRACRLDELPQILNILKGDMSVVGPRPERPVFVEQFEKEIENYEYRFEVKAGLTSLSHVYGRYSTYIHDRTYYDLFYITHYSLIWDLKIILLTTKTLFLKSAAEGEDDFKEKTVADKNQEEDFVEK